jgi:hypothetical protein
MKVPLPSKSWTITEPRHTMTRAKKPLLACLPIARLHHLARCCGRSFWFRLVSRRANWPSYGCPGRSGESDPAREAGGYGKYRGEARPCAGHERGVLAWITNRLGALARSSRGELGGFEAYYSQDGLGTGDDPKVARCRPEFVFWSQSWLHAESLAARGSKATSHPPTPEGSTCAPVGFC